MPDDLIAAAKVDGCGETAAFFRIALPLAAPIIALVGFFSFVANWNNFFLPYVMLPGSGQYPMPVGLVQMLSSTPTFNPVVSPGAAIQLPQLALATIISISPVLVIFLLAQRFLVTGLTAGATKGWACDHKQKTKRTERRGFPPRSSRPAPPAWNGRGPLRDPVPLASIPPLLLSEVLRDVDLFTGVASIGNDPEWQDHGPLPEADEVRAVCVAAGQVDYDAYWRASGFGELTEIAHTRADVLARLLPRLAIGPQCTIQGRFLHVRGTLHEYKIHLGSGNILMSPTIATSASSRTAGPSAATPA